MSTCSNVVVTEKEKRIGFRQLKGRKRKRIKESLKRKTRARKWKEWKKERKSIARHWKGKRRKRKGGRCELFDDWNSLVYGGNIPFSFSFANVPVLSCKPLGVKKSRKKGERGKKRNLCDWRGRKKKTELSNIMWLRFFSRRTFIWSPQWSESVNLWVGGRSLKPSPSI